MANYTKRERVMILGASSYCAVTDYLRDLGVDRETYDLKREDNGNRVYWIRFKASLPLFERLRKIARKAGDLIATTGYGY